MKYPELKQAYESVKKRLTSVYGVVAKREEEITSLRQKNQFLEARNTQLIQQEEIQSKIVHQTLENANKQNNEYLEEINRLRAEANGDHD